MTRVLVTGAGGFIGHHLVTRLRSEGFWVRGLDLTYPKFTDVDADDFQLLDLTRAEAALEATRGIDHVYALAADMGGMGFISSNNSRILHANSLIDLNTIEAARINGVSRLLYSSSACIYPEHLQEDVNVDGLKEEYAYPASPQDAYGWEKLIGELLCKYYAADHGMSAGVMRLHNVYGPYGTYTGGREKAPAALCRKVAQADDGDSVEIWGDGEQTRSFCYIEDCVEGIRRIMASGSSGPLNLGTEELVSINELAEIIKDISGKRNIRLTHKPGPQGVRGRNSDNTRLRHVLSWEPSTPLRAGLESTYRWIEKQVEGERQDSSQG
jgi:nucleoside-diphosphate-sugar epimerase